MKRYLIAAVTLAALLFASSAEAGPLRNGAKRVGSAVRNVAGRVTDVLPFGALRKQCGNSPKKLEGSRARAGGVCR
jgi:hypothetical protein